MKSTKNISIKIELDEEEVWTIRNALGGASSHEIVNASKQSPFTKECIEEQHMLLLTSFNELVNFKD